MDSFSGAMKLAGWQWLFLAEGIPSILVGIWVIFYLESSIEEAKWLTQEEKTFLAQNLQAEDRHKTEHKLVHAFASGKVWVLCAIYFTLMIGLYGIAFWLPTIVKAFGVKGYREVGLITAIPYGVSVIGMIFLSIGTLGVIGSMPLFWPLPSAFLAGTAAAAGIGIVNSVGNLGGYVGPNIPIWAKAVSSDKSAALYITSAILMVGALLTFFCIPKTLRVKVG